MYKTLATRPSMALDLPATSPAWARETRSVIMHMSVVLIGLLAIVPGIFAVNNIPKYNMTETGYPPKYCRSHECRLRNC